ncbi:hypothetical protein F2Q69_00030539 [Brassica cretica]|uniref:Uncharacterized protein n=1 Tax=Brassica cretica TaxID=69181 RepID=A0A8S9S170_BRACR|nr:hypothetical protein F2Q69_00030539 [Brassica cretica]
MASGLWMAQLAIWRAGHGRPSSPYGERNGAFPARSDFLWVILTVGSVGRPSSHFVVDVTKVTFR